MDRAALQQVMCEIVDDNTMHRTIHALIEVAHKRASLYTRMDQFSTAEQWTRIAMALTYAETVSMTRGM